RLVLVINGMKRERERIAEARRLLDVGYREFKPYQLMAAGETVSDANVFGGTKSKVALQVKDPLNFLMAPDARRGLKVTLRYDTPLKAPLAAGQEVGTVTVTVPGRPDKIVPVVAGEAVPSNGFFGNMMQGLVALVFGSKQA